MKCEKCGKKVKENVIKIYSRYNPSEVIFEYKGESLEGANLEGANLENASLVNANLEDASLVNANLEGASLVNANLKGANLKGTKLEGAKLEGANTLYCTINFSLREYEQAKQFIEGLKQK